MTSRRSRIAVPFVVAGLIGAGAALPSLEAGASPNLPKLSAKQVIEKVLRERVADYSGTFTWTANLGLPSISGLVSGGQGVSTASSFDPTSLTSGTHTFNVWVDGAAEQRLRVMTGSLSESDVVHRGTQAWVYDSGSDHVTHYVLAGTRPGTEPATSMDGLDPASVARNVLTGLASVHTDVSVSRSVDVAGRSAYVLRLAPDRAVAANAGSTVSAVLIAVDSQTGMPLRVTVDAAGQSGPALQIGYTSFATGASPASIFATPVGGTTTTKVVGLGAAAPLGSSHAATPTGSGWSGYAPLTASATPAPATGSPHASERRIVTYPAGHRPTPATAAHVTSVGRDWGSIAVIPAGQAGSLTGHGATASELATVTTAVSGSWGSGRILETSLANALFLPDGKVLVGFVTPATLEAAAAHA